MKGSLRTAIGFAMALGMVSPAAAQRISLFAGGGASIPVGTFGDFAKTGWIANLGFTVPLGEGGVWVGLETFYGSNKDSEIDDDKTEIPGAMALLGYRFGDPERPGLYVHGGLGFLSQQLKPAGTAPDESETSIAYGAGVGMDIPLGRVSFWIETRYIGSGESTFEQSLQRRKVSLIPIMAGISIPFGG